MERRGLLRAALLLCLLAVCSGRELTIKHNPSTTIYNSTLAKILVEYAAAIYTADLTQLFTWTCARCGGLIKANSHYFAIIEQWPIWELSEMEGRLCATCVDERVSAVVVICLDFARRDPEGAVAWTLVSYFEGGCVRGRKAVTLLRSQGRQGTKSANFKAMDTDAETY